MDMFEQLKWAVAHDPCRPDDRWPGRAVTVGTDVNVRLRVDASLRHLVSGVEAHVFDGRSWRGVILGGDRLGFSGCLPLERMPHVAFYLFELALVDGSSLFYVPRMDARSTAGELVEPERDGEWGGMGWTYSPEKWAQRPQGDTGLPDVMPGFQITVYEPGFSTPAWLDGAIMYQIFPDRFARGGAGVLQSGLDYHAAMGRPVMLHDDWDEAPRWTGEIASKARGKKPTINEQMAAYDPVDFFGGTLDGIRGKLDYLASLGVEVLYLNPIFEARSNHRYDTADYERIDPILGDEESFAALAAAARERGISIVLDAVLSHTGRDSKYFNASGAYDEPGAAQGPESRYFPWYEFFPAENGGGYRCWWGDPTLPEVDERSASWQRYMFGDGAGVGAVGAGVGSGEGDGAGAGAGAGVLAKWLGCGARGYRLDVADEIPDDVLERIRTCVKDSADDAAVIGEVWEDPTTKGNYDGFRTYALGRSLDSAMNYPLRLGLTSFALGTIDAHQLTTLLKHQQANYPEPMYRCLMNLLSSHDVERLRSVLSLGGSLKQHPRNEQFARVEHITVSQDARGAKLQKLIVGLLYAIPGMPCLYYGDERGLHGGGDPFCRATFPWEARRRHDCGTDTTDFYREVGMRRKNTEALRSGQAAFFAPHEDVVCVVRWQPGDARPVVTTANRATRPLRIAIDLRDSTPYDDVLVIDAPAQSTVTA